MKFTPRSLLFICLLSQILLHFTQAIPCEAGDYAENDICLPCGEGKSSPKGALSINECLPCADKGCKTCQGVTANSCSVCGLEYSLQNGECVSSNQGSPGTPFTCADKGCAECFGDSSGQCSVCDAGYYLANNQCTLCAEGKSSPKGSTSIDKCAPCDDYPNCQICTGLGQGQCSLCHGHLILINGACESTEIKCKDSNCIECSGPDTGDCLQCKVPKYLYSGECLSCNPEVKGCIKCDDKNCELCSGPDTGECLQCKVPKYLYNGECLSCNPEVKGCLSCDDKNCELCSGTGTGQCFSCEANYYLNENECTSCGDGKFSFAGSQNSTECISCEDENCLACNGANIGRCTSCLPGFVLISGTCKFPGNSVKTNNVVSASIRYDMTMAQFNNEGGKNYFIAKLSQILSVDIELITVKKVRKGSVIVDYGVATPGDENDAGIVKKAMDDAVVAGQMSFYGPSKVMNYNSEIGENESESEEKKSKKIGLIVGVAVGAVCVAVAILFWIKFAMVKAQMRRAAMIEKNSKKIFPQNDSIQNTFKTDLA